MNTRKTLFIILAIGLILRAGLLAFFWSQPLTIVDETHYQAIAENILNHHEFALRAGKPTSIRPPLYPAFLSFIYFITGGIHINAVRIVQIFLSLGIVCMVYVLGKKIFDEKTGLLASLIFAIYPSFLFFTHFLLTEVLFTLLFTIFVYFFLQFINYSRSSVQNNENTHTSSQPLNFPTSIPSPSQPPTFPPSVLSPSHLLTFSSSIAKRLSVLSALHYALLCGILLGLGALTRSILYPFLAPFLVFLFLFSRGSLKKRFLWCSIVLIGYSLVIGPWAIRNTLLHGQFVPVGTMGGLNLYMGNYEHTPLNRAWTAVDLNGQKAWFYGHEEELVQMNEAQKQKWAAAKAKDFMFQHKMLTIKRSLVKAANFWGLERSVLGGIVHNHWPELKATPLMLAAGLSIFAVYCFVLLCSIYGVFFNLTPNPVPTSFVLMLLMLFTSVHAIVFGHSRYHLPLIPLLSVYAAWSIIHMRSIIEKARGWHFRLSSVLAILAVVIWIREVVFVELQRYMN